MIKRKDILDSAAAETAWHGLIYKEVLGWVDLGHAQGSDIRMALGKMKHSDHFFFQTQ